MFFWRGGGRFDFIRYMFLLVSRMGFDGICIYGHASMVRSYMEQVILLLNCVSIFFFYLSSFFFLLDDCFVSTTTAVIVMIKSIKA